MIKTNVPAVPMMEVDGEQFSLYDRIRIQFKSADGFKWTGGGMIGEIIEIGYSFVKISFKSAVVNRSKVIPFDDILMARKARPDETFDTDFCYNEEEAEFWRTHWYTHDGVQEKPAHMIH